MNSAKELLTYCQIIEELNNLKEKQMMTDCVSYESTFKNDCALFDKLIRSKKLQTTHFSGSGKYIGQLENRDAGEIRVGFGKYTYETGHKYIGQWKDGFRDGIGECQFVSTNKYIGMWQHDRRNGYGRFYYKRNGTYEIYEGNFVEDQKEGFGKYTSYTKEIYCGFFEKNQRHGEGVYIFGGKKYVGNYLNNKRNGIGALYFLDVLIYLGGWVDGQRHGYNYMYDEVTHNTICEKYAYDEFVCVKGIHLHYMKTKLQIIGSRDVCFRWSAF